jgi:hypothetical protein
VELEVANDGSTPITLPVLNDPYAAQPYFVVNGPGLEKPERFHWRGRAPSGESPPRNVESLAPGQSLKGTLTLPVSAPMNQEGEYEIYATYELQGTTAESNHARLKMTTPDLTVFRLVGRTPLRSLLGIQSAAVGGSTLYLASFVEKRPEIGETKFSGISALVDLDAGATDLFAPWCQTAEMGPITPRFGWRVRNRITVAGFRKLPQSIELPFAPRVYAPSLMNADGSIDLLVTDAAGLEIALVHFPQTEYNEDPPPATLVWKHALNQPVSALTASINPSGEKAAVIRQGSSVSLMRWTNEGPSFEHPATLPEMPIAEVAPAIHITMSGVIRASILTRVGDGSEKHVAVTEFLWAKGVPPAISTAPAVELPSPIRSGSIAYSMHSIDLPRREWFFVLSDGRVLSSRMDGKARSTKLKIPEPPQLAIMDAAAYVIVVDTTPRLTMLQ